ncbi:MAG: hypothetical protein ABI972_04620 [Acidobacteriota bacterium]
MIDGGHFNVYGYRFRVTAEAETSSVEGLANDFAFFQTEPATNSIEIRLSPSEPDYRGVPGSVASVYTPRNVAVTDGRRKYLDYGGRALAIHDREANVFHVQSTHADLLYESAFLFLLSSMGEALDASRLHRIHALALGYHGRAVLAILPMGGGKSTLGASLLGEPDFNLLSDDSPLIASDGTVYALPLRLGLLPGSEGGVPAEFRRTIDRMEFGPKILVKYSYFAHRVKPSAEPGIVFMGYRSLSDKCRIEPAGSMESYKSMMANCVIGLGLFQGLEFVVNNSAMEIAGKARVAMSRLHNARTLFKRSEVYRLILGRDRAENARAVAEFVRKRLPAAPAAGS